MRSIQNFGLKQLRFVVLSLAIIVLATALVRMGSTVRDQFQSLESAPHDNLQWSLSQLDVEHARLQLAIVLAMQDPDADLAPLRRRFDLFYSRSQTVTSIRSSMFLMPDELLNDLLGALHQRTLDLATIVDQDEESLRRDLPLLFEQTQDRNAFMQRLSGHTIALFAKTSDELRAGLSELLFQIAIAALLLAISFVAVVYLLYVSVREAKATQTTLANVTARLQSTIGASLDAVIVSDKNGLLIDYNGAAEQVFGYPKGDVLGKPALNFLIPENNRLIMRTEIRQHLETGQSPLVGSGLHQLKGLKKGGQIIPIEVSIAPALDGDETIFISFVRDISEREAIKDNLLQARDDALNVAKAKSDFATVMSHEMRTPLNGVIAALEVLSSTNLTPYQNKFFSIARSSADHLLGHINDVLDIATMDAAVLEPRHDVFNPLAAIEEVIENAQSLARERGNSLGADFKGADSRFYRGDEGRFRRILINLLGNAIKFTKNGHIEIDFGTYPQADGTVCLELHVTDNGRGIPQDKLKEIFNDFVRLDARYDRETSGTGLGLSITQSLVATLGGELGVDSEVGVGSTFWVKLPFEDCPQPNLHQEDSASVAPPSATGSLKGKPALLVEDNAINRTIMLEVLKDVGLEMTTAENGLLGVEAANSTKFEYIFMDVSMPVLDGITATKILRTGRKGASFGAKIFGFTAHSSKKSRDECLAAGMDDVLVKPVSRADILCVLGFGLAQMAPALSPDSGLLDLKQIESIQGILGDERFSKTCARFRVELKKGRESLREDTKNDPPTGLSKDRIAQVHKLAGLSASMGARALHQRLEKVQIVAEAENTEALLEELQIAIACLERTLNADVYKDASILNEKITERSR